MKKRDFSTPILILVFLSGLVVLLYPAFSDWWNSRVQSRAIVNYDAVVADLSQEDYDAEFARADAYNEALGRLSSPLVNYDRLEGYEDILNAAGNGIMGYIEIPAIDVKLPIYHGTSDAVLNVAVGHLEGTSLPVGGKSVHCVLSGHRGLPSAKLFTNLDKLAEGDTFTITVLNRLLTYEVDQILVVEPEETEELAVVEGEDYVTLLTCTPYGINTHRLLVRGRRIENAAEAGTDRTAGANGPDLAMLAPVAAALLLLLLLFILLAKRRKPKGRGRRGREEENESHE